MLPLLAGFWYDQAAYCVSPAFIYTNVMQPLLAGFWFDQAAYCVSPAFIYTNVNATIARRFLVWPGRLLRGSRLHLNKRQCCHCSQVSGLTRPPIAWLPPSFTQTSMLPLLAGFWYDQAAYCVAPAFIYTNVMLPLLAGFWFDQAAYCVAPAFIYTNVMLPLLAGFWYDQAAYCVAPAFIYTNVMLPLLAGFWYDQAAYCVSPAFIYTNVNATIARRFLVWPGRLLRGSRLHLNTGQGCYPTVH